MIGRHQCSPTSMAVQALQSQHLIEVDVIQRKDGKPSGERPKSSEVSTHIGFVEVRDHSWSYRTPKPFIEVAQNDPGTMQFLIRDDPAIDQLARLLALFEEPGSKVNIENVEDVLVEADVSPQAASPLASAGADVVVLMALYGEAGQQDIAVSAALMPAILAKREVKSQFLGDKPRLVLFRRSTLKTYNLLQRNNIGVQLPQHVGDAVRLHAPVHATTLVDVVGDNA